MVSEGLLGQLSTAVPKATLDMALQMFRGCGVEVVDEHAFYDGTVQQIVSELTKFLGIGAWEIAPSSFRSICAERVMEVIRSQVLRAEEQEKGGGGQQTANASNAITSSEAGRDVCNSYGREMSCDMWPPRR